MQIQPSRKTSPYASRTKTVSVGPKENQTKDSFEPSQGPSGLGGFIDKAKEVAKRALKGLARPKLPLYGEKEQTHEVDIKRLDFKDESRDRDIPLVIYSPKDSENVENSPVVVFSHGLAGNEYTYRYFGKYLASHGYTVLQPTHEGSDTTSFLRRPGVKIFSQKELVDRGKDVSFALDLLEQGKLPEDVTSKVDLENVALAGHSFGALTAQAMAGVTVTNHDGQGVPIEDDRFDAYIAMSPYGDSLPTHLLGMDPKTYGQIEKPILTLSGDHDRLFTGGEGPRVHRDTFNGASSKHKYHLEIDKTLHASFAQMFGLVGVTAAMTNSTSLAFLDAHLKQDGEAHNYLLHDLPKVARSYKSDAFIGPHGSKT